MANPEKPDFKNRGRKEEILAVEYGSLRPEPLVFTVGDTVDVHCRIKEGDKERVQIFTGVVIARRGTGTSAMFTVRRIVAGEGVERIFPDHCPNIAKLVVKRHGKVRRAKLYYLRDRIGKATRLAERRGKVTIEEGNAAAAKAKETAEVVAAPAAAPSA